MKLQLFAIVLILVLLVTGAYFYGKQMLSYEPEHIPGATGENMFVSGAYGISFSYPDYYDLRETEVGTQHAIVLTHKDDAVLPEAGEGPRTITLMLYPHDAQENALDEWLLTPESNLSLGDGVQAHTTVASRDAISYSWSGLYEGETTAFVYGDYIVAVSVTYLSRTDQIRADYLALLATLATP